MFYSIATNIMNDKKRLKWDYFVVLETAVLFFIYMTLPSIQVKRKKAAHAGMFDIAKTTNRPMIHIGG